MNYDQRSTHSFWRFFIENYRVTYLIVSAAIVFGVVAIFLLPKESAPEVDIPVAVVTTTLPGAGAQSVEELVTDPLEDQITGMSDVTDIFSTSEQGLSSIQIQYDSGVDKSETIASLRNRVDRAIPDLPDDAGESRVQQISFSDQPILTMALSGPMELEELKIYADELADEFETITNVSQVNITGAPERQIRVMLEPNRLNQLNISAQQVAQALANANTDVPVGAIEANGYVYTVRFDGRFTDADDVRSTAVLEQNGSLITVDDVASIEDVYAEQNTISRFSTGGKLSRPTVSLHIFKESGEGNILTVSKEADRIVEGMSEERFPSDLIVETIRSDAELISSDLRTLTISGVITVFLIFVILSLFLGWREALLASLVVPLSFLITFVAIYLFGLTINFLTLFSLILSLGIIVDASIVVTESIFTKRSAGAGGVDAAMRTIDEFQAPLVAGTMTTVLVFVPMIFAGGIIGEFIFSIPVTVSSVLVAALFVGLGIITTLTTRFLPAAHTGTHTGFLGIGVLIKKIYVWYGAVLRDLLQYKKRARLFFASITALFIVAVSFPFVGVADVNMFPSPDADTIYLDLVTSAGTPIGGTSFMIKQIEDVLSEDERIDSFLSTIGQGSQVGSIDIASVADSHIASITISLSDARDDTSTEIENEYQERFADFNGADITVAQPGGGPEQGAPVQIKLVGDDLAVLEKAAGEAARVLESIDGARAVDDGINETAGEFSVSIDKDVAQRYGVRASDVSNTLRTAVSGSVATDITTADEDIQVVVIFDIGGQANVGAVKQIDLSEIQSIPIQTNRGNVPLDTFSDISFVPGRSAISHEDGDRVITVTARTNEGANVSNIITEFKSYRDELNIPPGVSMYFGGETEDIRESFTDLAVGMAVGVLAIFALMVWQFRSYRQPLFILITIPLALTGVFLGLAIVRQPLSFPGFIGIVALAGVVVNNAIILIDAINHQRIDQQKDISTAVLDGARSRLQPVILTTITTVAGLIPLTVSDPTWAPVAYSMIFGLLFASVLTLAVIPLLYNRFAERVLDTRD